MKEPCEDLNDNAKCKSCAFTDDKTSTCANPKIWESPPADSYYKHKGAELTGDEITSIEIHLTA